MLLIPNYIQRFSGGLIEAHRRKRMTRGGKWKHETCQTVTSYLIDQKKEKTLSREGSLNYRPDMTTASFNKTQSQSGLYLYRTWCKFWLLYNLDSLQLCLKVRDLERRLCARHVLLYYYKEPTFQCTWKGNGPGATITSVRTAGFEHQILRLFAILKSGIETVQLVGCSVLALDLLKTFAKL